MHILTASLLTQYLINENELPIGMSSASPRASYDKVFEALDEHQNWFANSIPLIASENIPSPAVREAITSDFGNRYAEGWAGERVYAGCTYIDQVELICMDLARRLFGAEFADVRPVSGVNANLTVYSAFTDPGDTMMALAIPNGGHISAARKEFNGTAGLVHGLNVEYFAFDRDNWNIDVDKIKGKNPETRGRGEKTKDGNVWRLAVFVSPSSRRTGRFLQERRHLCVLRFGARFGTHRGEAIPGPSEGGSGRNDPLDAQDAFRAAGRHRAFVEQVRGQDQGGAFPGTSSNHHLHHVAGKAVAFAEFLEFGEEYAKQVISNAQELAQALNEQGVDVLAANMGFTKSHQIAVNITKYGGGGDLEKDLEKANIILNRQLIPGDVQAGRHYQNPGGLRIGTSEITRLGMKKEEMRKIASLMARIIVKKEDPAKVKQEVEEMRKAYQKVHYAFEPNTPAYKYIRVR